MLALVLKLGLELVPELRLGLTSRVSIWAQVTVRVRVRVRVSVYGEVKVRIKALITFP